MLGTVGGLDGEGVTLYLERQRRVRSATRWT